MKKLAVWPDVLNGVHMVAVIGSFIAPVLVVAKQHTDKNFRKNLYVHFAKEGRVHAPGQPQYQYSYHGPAPFAIHIQQTFAAYPGCILRNVEQASPVYSLVANGPRTFWAANGFR